MSRFLNHKRSRPSTPISPRSYQSSPPLISREEILKPQKPHNSRLRIWNRRGARKEPREAETSQSRIAKMMTPDPLENASSSSAICPGTLQPSPSQPSLAVPVAKKPVGYCDHTTETFPELSSSSNLLPTVLPESLPPNGNASSKETQSTSIKSSRRSTMLSLMKRERAAWEKRKSALVSLNQRKRFEPQQNGLPHGGEHLKQSALLSPIVEKSSLITETTSNPNLQRNSHHPITSSSSTTLPSEMKLPEGRVSYSQTTTSSAGCTRPSYYRTVSRDIQTTREERNLDHLDKEVESQNYATSSTLEPANTPMMSASTCMHAKSVENLTTGRRTARTGPSEIYGLQPKYLRHNLWEESSSLSQTTAEWSERARPLARPGLSEYANSAAVKTILDNPDLFQVRTPIIVDVFESLLRDHPNPAFVNSVCVGLREGFWPWACTMHDSFPITHDESRPMPGDDKKCNFIREQCQKERYKGYFSESFGTELLPGMYSMPIHAVPKPHSSDLRLVTDHSAGLFSLNGMIDHSAVTGFPLDNVTNLGEMLLDTRRSIGNVPLTLWKSDIADAYRLLPVSPFWQIKQIVTVDGERYVDRNLAFGSSASCGIFISFNSLVAWIAKNERGVGYLANYVDDSSGCDLTGNTLFYEPYGKFLPANQTKLLCLWDDLGIPHKPHKQVFGSPLVIIGIEVNPNLMTLTLPKDATERLLEELAIWSSKPPSNSSGSFKLKHWERLAGWFNWALNVFPLLRPALNNLYAKMSGKQKKEQRIYINNAVRDDLMWAIKHIKKSDGVHLFKSITWKPASADVVIFCDACPEGMGFWYPTSKDGYYAPTPVNSPSNAIFYFEALCVLSALHHVQSKARKGSKILIYTDNANTVDMFRSLRCLPVYNPLLKSAVDVLIDQDFSLRVLHVPGEDNIIADALSRIQFSVALQKEPCMRLYDFHPPDLVGSTL